MATCMGLYSSDLLKLLCRVVWCSEEPEAQLTRAVAQHLALLPAAACATASASQLGGASVLGGLQLWAKWKKQTGKSLQQLLTLDTSGLLSIVSSGKAEKAVVLHADMVPLALSLLHDACEAVWRPSRGVSAWVKCELARMIISHQYCHPDSSALFRCGLPELMVQLRRAWAVQDLYDPSEPPFTSMAKLLDGEPLFKLLPSASDDVACNISLDAVGLMKRLQERSSKDLLQQFQLQACKLPSPQRQEAKVAAALASLSPALLSAAAEQISRADPAATGPEAHALPSCLGLESLLGLAAIAFEPAASCEAFACGEVCKLCIYDAFIPGDCPNLAAFATSLTRATNWVRGRWDQAPSAAGAADAPAKSTLQAMLLAEPFFVKAPSSSVRLDLAVLIHQALQVMQGQPLAQPPPAAAAPMPAAAAAAASSDAPPVLANEDESALPAGTADAPSKKKKKGKSKGAVPASAAAAAAPEAPGIVPAAPAASVQGNGSIHDAAAAAAAAPAHSATSTVSSSPIAPYNPLLQQQQQQQQQLEDAAASLQICGDASPSHTDQPAAASGDTAAASSEQQQKGDADAKAHTSAASGKQVYRPPHLLRQGSASNAPVSSPASLPPPPPPRHSPHSHHHGSSYQQRHSVTTAFVGSPGPAYDAMLAHLSLCSEFALLLRTAEGGVTGSHVPEHAQGSNPSPSASNPIAACIYTPDAVFGAYHVPASAYILELMPCMVDDATGTVGPNIVPAYGLLAGLRSLLEDPARCKIVLGCDKVHKQLQQLCGIHMQCCLDVQQAHTLLAAAAACRDLQASLGGSSSGSKMRHVDFVRVAAGHDSFHQLLSAQGLQPPLTAAAARTQLARNKNVWLARPLPKQLQDHAGAEAAALFALGHKLQEELGKDGALQPLMLAHAELAPWIARTGKA